jgi:hypothetical protein
MPLNAHVSMEAGRKMTVAEGSRLVFGRGPGVDLAIAAGRGLSRRAGVVTAMAAGVWIANISRTHALYVEGQGYRIRLPRMEHDGEPADGWFVHAGTVYVGSRAMLDEQQPLAVTVTGQFEGWSSRAPQADGAVPDADARLTYRAGRADLAGLTAGAAPPAGSGFAGAVDRASGTGPANEANGWNGAGAVRAGGPGPARGTRRAGQEALGDESGPAERTGEADGTGEAERTGLAEGTGKADGTREADGTGKAGGTGEADRTGLADRTGEAERAGEADRTGLANGSGLAGGTMLDDGTGLVSETIGTKEAGGAERSGEAGGAGRSGEAEGARRPGEAGGAGRPGEAERGGGRPGEAERGGGEGTLLPFYIDPMTKLFLVALIWCRPWLLDASATRPLPRTPEIARGALEVTGAYRELKRFDSDPEFRDLLSARVAEHIKVLRRKITDNGLATANVRLSDEVVVRILIDHGIITSADLGRLDDPGWRSRQEDLWWTQG